MRMLEESLWLCVLLILCTEILHIPGHLPLQVCLYYSITLSMATTIWHLAYFSTFQYHLSILFSQKQISLDVFNCLFLTEQTKVKLTLNCFLPAALEETKWFDPSSCGELSGLGHTFCLQTEFDWRTIWLNTWIKLDPCHKGPDICVGIDCSIWGHQEVYPLTARYFHRAEVAKETFLHQVVPTSWVQVFGHKGVKAWTCSVPQAGLELEVLPSQAP